MKRIFLVDADDTLLDFHGSAQKGLRVAFAKCGLVWQEEYAKRFKEINDKLWESLERKELTRATLMRERFPLFLAALGLDSSIGETFNRHYLEYLANNPPTTTATRGVMMISTGVRFDTSEPASTPTMEAR